MTTIADICSMYVLLAAATRAEIEPCLSFLEQHDFFVGPHEIDVLITGVGSVTTTHLLTYNIFNCRPDLAIQAGIAGSLAANNGKLFSVSTEQFGDLGVWENGQFKTVFDLGLAEPDGHPFQQQKLVNPYHALLELAGFEGVAGVTVNEITTIQQKIEWYRQQSLTIESMEGAAFHYVCLAENIPFIQLRAVSNIVGERDKTNWAMAEAIQTLNTELISFLQKLEPCDETKFRI